MVQLTADPDVGTTSETHQAEEARRHGDAILTEYFDQPKSPGQEKRHFANKLRKWTWERFEGLFKKDSLWYSEDLAAVPGRDAGRVCILQGPVAVRFSTRADEPVGDILRGIERGLVDHLAAAPGAPPIEPVEAVEYGGRDRAPRRRERAHEEPVKTRREVVRDVAGHHDARGVRASQSGGEGVGVRGEPRHGVTSGASVEASRARSHSAREPPSRTTHTPPTLEQGTSPIDSQRCEALHTTGRPSRQS
jgi:hypothetical protein